MRFCTLALVGAALALPVTAMAEEEGSSDVPLAQAFDPEDEAEIIQNKKYDLASEITFSVGTFPADAFYKGFTGTVGYTLHLSDSLAWEIGSFTYSLNTDANLKNEVKRIALSTGQDPPEFPEITWMAATHLVLKPFYGKQALFNTNVVHVEIFLQGGGAFVMRDETDRKVGFGLDVGFGLRLWFTEVVSMRLDVGELVYIVPAKADQSTNVEQALHLHLGISFNIRGED